MLKYTYNDFYKIAQKRHLDMCDEYRLIKGFKKLWHTDTPNYIKANQLRALGLINFDGDAKHKHVTDLDIHTMFKIVVFGCYVAIFVESLKEDDTGKHKRIYVMNHYNMYRDILQAKYYEIHDYDRYKHLLPFYHEQLVKYYGDGYDFYINFLKIKD